MKGGTCHPSFYPSPAGGASEVCAVKAIEQTVVFAHHVLDDFGRGLDVVNHRGCLAYFEFPLLKVSLEDATLGTSLAEQIFELFGRSPCILGFLHLGHEVPLGKARG